VDVHEDNSLVDLLGAVPIYRDGMPSHQIIVDGEVVDAEDQSHMPPTPD
jgi:hypothetical protein